jgi:phosphoglycerate dehydrogenase-like enzyme
MSPKPVHSNQWHVGLISYGEVGRILAEDLRKDGVRVSAYDKKPTRACSARRVRKDSRAAPTGGSRPTASWLD